MSSSKIFILYTLYYRYQGQNLNMKKDVLYFFLLQILKHCILIKQHWNASGSDSVPLKTVLNAHLHVTSLCREKSTETPNARPFVSCRIHQSHLLSLDGSLHNRCSKLRKIKTKNSLKLWNSAMHNHLPCCLAMKDYVSLHCPVLNVYLSCLKLWELHQLFGMKCSVI